MPAGAAPADTKTDLVGSSPDYFGLNRGTCLTVTIQATNTTSAVTVTIYVRSTSSASDVFVPEASVYVIPATTARYRIQIPLIVGEVARVTGQHGDAFNAQTVTVSAEVTTPSQ